MKRTLTAIALGLATLFGVVTDVSAARLKDLASVQGVRENQILGYGLVVGLAGTGDFGQSEFTVQSTASMLSRMGIRVDKEKITTRNVAAVIVTAELPPFARSGQRLDITVSSLGNARSLQGGTLLMTPLKGADGQVYAVAQGALSVGGFSVGPEGNSQTKNHVTAGLLPNGALVEKNVEVNLNQRESLRLILRDPDFTTAAEIARVVSGFMTPAPAADPNAAAADPNAAAAPEKTGLQDPNTGPARAIDAGTVQVDIPENFRDSVPQFIAAIETLEVTPGQIAKVVVNERTGTVVLGGDVRIREVAIAHGNLNVTISSFTDVSQPGPLAKGNTARVTNTETGVEEEGGALKVVTPGGSIGDVVSALNALGASPRDLIAILQAIEAAGALDARLVIQ